MCFVIGRWSVTKLNFAENGDKVTYRGCKTSLQSGIQQIEVCRTDSCNDMIFPRNRLQCLQCAGYDCIFPNETQYASMPCANYVARDQCYVVVAGTIVIKYLIEILIKCYEFIRLQCKEKLCEKHSSVHDIQRLHF